MHRPLCQSCGMPLYSPEWSGTEASGARTGEYCLHCYRDGRFTQAVTMEGMIRLCAGESRVHAACLRALYPRLTRWAKKVETENDHYRAIRRVVDHLKDHWQGPADLRTLAGIARLSPWHFHRIFRQVMGESLAGYVLRGRMEYVCERLRDSPRTLAELAERTGYSSEQALSRAFKGYFDLPPKTFRRLYFQQTFGGELVPRVCRVAARSVIALREGGDWPKLYLYALMHRLLTEATESIEVIDGGVFRPALSVRELPAAHATIVPRVLPEGLHAIFTHRGDPAALPALWAAIRNYWLPTSKYAPAPSSAYVVYLNHTMNTPPAELLAEVYVPIRQEKA